MPNAQINCYRLLRSYHLYYDTPVEASPSPLNIIAERETHKLRHEMNVKRVLRYILFVRSDLLTRVVRASRNSFRRNASFHLDGRSFSWLQIPAECHRCSCFYWSSIQRIHCTSSTAKRRCIHFEFYSLRSRWKYATLYEHRDWNVNAVHLCRANPTKYNIFAMRVIWSSLFRWKQRNDFGAAQIKKSRSIICSCICYRDSSG